MSFSFLFFFFFFWVLMQNVESIVIGGAAPRAKCSVMLGRRPRASYGLVKKGWGESGESGKESAEAFGEYGRWGSRSTPVAGSFHEDNGARRPVTPPAKVELQRGKLRPLVLGTPVFALPSIPSLGSFHSTPIQIISSQHRPYICQITLPNMARKFFVGGNFKM
jgi:hypothetical protein